MIRVMVSQRLHRSTMQMSLCHVY